MLNQSIAEDAEFNEMSLEAQLMFLRTLPFLDRDGLINGNASVLRGRVAPLLDLPKSMASIVDEWVNADLVLRYTVGKQTIIFFPSFAKNQIGMRYERETASTYPPPPGYKRTPKGLIAPGESQPQQPPKDDADTNESVAQPNGEPLPEECRNIAGNVPDDCRAKVMEENRIEVEGNSAHAQEATPLPVSAIPPTLPISTPPQQAYRRREQVHIDGMQTRLTKFGIDARQFTAMVDSHLSAKGTKELADGDGDAADRELRAAQQFVVDLCGIGRRFYSVDGIKSVWDSWKTNDKRPNPSAHQLLEHASQMVAGKVGKGNKGGTTSSANGNAKPAGVYVGVAENLK
jgi:hypothetical protein